MSDALKMKIKHLIGGILAGVVVSVIPWELACLITGLLLVMFCVKFRHYAGTNPIRVVSISVPAALAVVVVAVLLPVKHLDREVGPISYGTMTLDELTRSLATDWEVYANPDYSASTNVVIGFRTSGPMTRREVLRKLSRETGSEIRIAYCATGASFLFGASPSLTRLKIAPPNTGANGGQRIRSETN